MNAYNVIDAFSQAFFALLGIWAAVDRRHWFVRFVVVTGALLAALLIPAYEVVIEFGLQMTLIMAGVWIARGERHWPPRLSLETALLSMVVVAVAAAVVAHIPELQPGVWAFMLNIAVSTALFSLLALWVVFGPARLHTRLLLAFPCLVLFIALFHFGSAIEYMMWRTSGSFTWPAFREAYGWENVWWWLARNLPTIALAAPVMIGVLLLARESRWFDAASTIASNKSAFPRRAMVARVSLALILLVVLTPLLTLFYRLLTPPSLAEAPPLPSPNGFDDFVSAGNMVPPVLVNAVRAPTSRHAFKQVFIDLQPAADLVARGLQKDSLVPLEDLDRWGGVKNETAQAVDRAGSALYLRGEYLRRYGTIDQYLAELLALMKLEQEAGRGSIWMLSQFSNWQPVATSRLRSEIHRLDASQLRELGARLRELDSSREPFDQRAERQLLYDQNAVWTRRLNIILNRWSGKAPFASERTIDQWRVSHLRLFIADVAAQTFWLDHGRPADSWQELVPEYLPAIPRDAIVDAPLRYRRQGSRYVIYSISLDDIDERIRTLNYSGDQAVSGPHHPPLGKQIRDAAAAGLKRLGRRIQREGEAPAEP
jgi:hypothetical protein